VGSVVTTGLKMVKRCNCLVTAEVTHILVCCKPGASNLLRVLDVILKVNRGPVNFSLLFNV
jgi:hypothetical protein